MVSKYLSGGLIALGILSGVSGFAMVGQLPKEEMKRPSTPMTEIKLGWVNSDIKDITSKLQKDSTSNANNIDADLAKFNRLTYQRDSLAASPGDIAEKADYQNAIAEIDKKNKNGETASYAVVGLLGAGLVLAGIGAVLELKRKD